MAFWVAVTAQNLNTTPTLPTVAEGGVIIACAIECFSEFAVIHLFDLGFQKRGFVDLCAQAKAIAETRYRLIKNCASYC